MNIYSIFVAVAVSLTVLSECGAILFGRKRDCSISSWSDWTSPPAFGGTITRERAILGHPANGGKACPTDLVQTRHNVPPTIKGTAASIKTHFIRRQGQALGGKSVGLKRDLLVIIDSSGSITSSNFAIVKDQMARLIGLLCPVPDPFKLSKNYQRAALIEYSTVVTDVFDFNDKANTYQVQAAIKGLPYMGSSTCTATAFKKAEAMLSVARGMRTDPDVKQEILILTDGQSNCGGDAIQAAQSLKNKADVFGLMIGSHSSGGKQELLSYVTGPVGQHLFAIQNFQELNLLLNELESQLSQPGAPPCAPFDV